jgi:hypothetical protein
MFTGPFQFGGEALHLKRAAAEPGFDNEAIWCAWLGHKHAELEQWGRHGTV